MATESKRALLLWAIFAIAFLLRGGVLFHDEYPPSTDVGLHSNVVNLILDGGELPLYNPYHMGGEPLANPPGYHIFASFIVLSTGMPLLVVQPLVAAFFSSFATFPAYLLSKRLWKSSNAGLLSALLVTVSIFSLEMLGWGGYPNVISLTLIPIVFYLFLKYAELPRSFNVVAASLILSSLIITHLFSFVVLLPIIALYIALLVIARILKLAESNVMNSVRFFSVSIALGILLASPWLVRVSGFYLGMFSEGAFLGGMEENKSLILINRYVDIKILVFAGAILPLLFRLKASQKRNGENDVRARLLLIAWYLVPLVATQAYIVGVFVDYSRFLYFAELPGLLILAAALFYLLRYVSIAIKKYSSGKWKRVGGAASKIAPPLVLLVAYSMIPLLITPTEALARVSFYNSIRQPEAKVLDWIQETTANSSVLVSDHLYGWWLSGVAQRSTLSAVSPEFLLYPHEVDIAEAALILLDTNYYVDNGLIQVREDGVHLARHNPIFIINREPQLPYSVFHFSDDETTIFVEGGSHSQALDLSDIFSCETHFNVEDKDSAVLTIVRENSFLTVTKTLTIRRGVRFAELSYVVESKDNETVVNWMRFVLHLRRGKAVIKQQMMSLFDDHAMVVGQIIFNEAYPETKIYTRENPSSAEFLYSTNSSYSTKISFLIGLHDASNWTYKEILEVLDEEPADPFRFLDDRPIVASSYLQTVDKYGIMFIVCRDQLVYPKFSDDLKFASVYNSENVAIFRVTG